MAESLRIAVASVEELPSFQLRLQEDLPAPETRKLTHEQRTSSGSSLSSKTYSKQQSKADDISSSPPQHNSGLLPNPSSGYYAILMPPEAVYSSKSMVAGLDTIGTVAAGISPAMTPMVSASSSSSTTTSVSNSNSSGASPSNSSSQPLSSSSTMFPSGVGKVSAIVSSSVTTTPTSTTFSNNSAGNSSSAPNSNGSSRNGSNSHTNNNNSVANNRRISKAKVAPQMYHSNSFSAENIPEKLIPNVNDGPISRLTANSDQSHPENGEHSNNNSMNNNSKKFRSLISNPMNNDAIEVCSMNNIPQSVFNSSTPTIIENINTVGARNTSNLAPSSVDSSNADGTSIGSTVASTLPSSSSATTTVTSSSANKKILPFSIGKNLKNMSSSSVDSTTSENSIVTSLPGPSMLAHFAHPGSKQSKKIVSNSSAINRIVPENNNNISSNQVVPISIEPSDQYRRDSTVSITFSSPSPASSSFVSIASSKSSSGFDLASGSAVSSNSSTLPSSSKSNPGDRKDASKNKSAQTPESTSILAAVQNRGLSRSNPNNNNNTGIMEAKKSGSGNSFQTQKSDGTLNGVGKSRQSSSNFFASSTLQVISGGSSAQEFPSSSSTNNSGGSLLIDTSIKNLRGAASDGTMIPQPSPKESITTSSIGTFASNDRQFNLLHPGSSILSTGTSIVGGSLGTIGNGGGGGGGHISSAGGTSSKSSFASRKKTSDHHHHHVHKHDINGNHHDSSIGGSSSTAGMIEEHNSFHSRRTNNNHEFDRSSTIPDEDSKWSSKISEVGSSKHGTGHSSQARNIRLQFRRVFVSIFHAISGMFSGLFCWKFSTTASPNAAPSSASSMHPPHGYDPEASMIQMQENKNTDSGHINSSISTNNHPSNSSRLLKGIYQQQHQQQHSVIHSRVEDMNHSNNQQNHHGDGHSEHEQTSHRDLNTTGAWSDPLNSEKIASDSARSSEADSVWSSDAAAAAAAAATAATTTEPLSKGVLKNSRTTSASGIIANSNPDVKSLVSSFTSFVDPSHPKLSNTEQDGLAQHQQQQQPHDQQQLNRQSRQAKKSIVFKYGNSTATSAEDQALTAKSLTTSSSKPNAKTTAASVSTSTSASASASVSNSASVKRSTRNSDASSTANGAANPGPPDGGRRKSLWSSKEDEFLQQKYAQAAKRRNTLEATRRKLELELEEAKYEKLVEGMTRVGSALNLNAKRSIS